MENMADRPIIQGSRGDINLSLLLIQFPLFVYVSISPIFLSINFPYRSIQWVFPIRLSISLSYLDNSQFPFVISTLGKCSQTDRAHWQIVQGGYRRYTDSVRYASSGQTDSTGDIEDRRVVYRNQEFSHPNGFANIIKNVKVLTARIVRKIAWPSPFPKRSYRFMGTAQQRYGVSKAYSNFRTNGLGWKLPLQGPRNVGPQSPHPIQ